MELTQLYLKSVLHYDPDTGVFTWIKCSKQNQRFLGKSAGTVGNRGYRFIRVNNKTYQAHRLVFLYLTGSFPPIGTDHINGVRDDNRWVNLRAVDAAENKRNTKRPKHNTSGVIGVRWYKQNSKWLASISTHGKRIYLGLFSDKDAAIAVRKSAEKRYGFHENHGR